MGVHWSLSRYQPIGNPTGNCSGKRWLPKLVLETVLVVRCKMSLTFLPPFPYISVQVTFRTAQAQVIGFALYSFYSCFLYTGSFSALPAFLSSNVVGKGTGLLTFVTGIVSLINIPLVSAVGSSLGGDFFWTYLIYLLLLIPCVFLVCGMGRQVQLEAQADEEAARKTFLIRYPPGGKPRSVWTSSIWTVRGTNRPSGRHSSQP